MKKLFITLLVLLQMKGLMAQIISGPNPYVIKAGEIRRSPGMTITSTGVLNNLGTLILDGDFENNGTIQAMHALEFDGTSAQQYKGKPMTLDSLYINTAGVTINAPVTVRSGVKFSVGLLTSSAANPLTLASGAGVSTPTDGSHVNGPVKYLGISSFTFPVGDATHYRPVSINLSVISSGMTATYYRASAPKGSLSGGLQAVSQYEYWTVVPSGTANGTVTLNWDASKVGVGILNPLGVLAIRTAFLSGSTWLNQGGLGIGTTSTGSVTSSTIFNWNSPATFALGSTNAIIAPLPLNFLGIEATLLPDGSRKIDWQVANEQQLKDYTVERSTDGQQFVEAGAVPATGASDYSYTDAASVASDKLYYRARGNDLDGKVTYSIVTSVEKGSGTGSGIGLMPNPVKDQLTVSFGPGMQGRYRLDILSIDGHTIYNTEFKTSGNQRFVVRRPGGISQGMYVARFYDDNGHVYTYKIVFE